MRLREAPEVISIGPLAAEKMTVVIEHRVDTRCAAETATRSARRAGVGSHEDKYTSLLQRNQELYSPTLLLCPP